MATTCNWFIRHIAEIPWRQFPDHFGGALSKPLVMPETAGSQQLDYRISMYQPMAYVKVHRHKVQEQVYHVLEGEASCTLTAKTTSCASTIAYSCRLASIMPYQTQGLLISCSS